MTNEIEDLMQQLVFDELFNPLMELIGEHEGNTGITCNQIVMCRILSLAKQSRCINTTLTFVRSLDHIVYVAFHIGILQPDSIDSNFFPHCPFIHLWPIHLHSFFLHCATKVGVDSDDWREIHYQRNSQTPLTHDCESREGGSEHYRCLMSTETHRIANHLRLDVVVDSYDWREIQNQCGSQTPLAHDCESRGGSEHYLLIDVNQNSSNRKPSSP